MKNKTKLKDILKPINQPYFSVNDDIKWVLYEYNKLIEKELKKKKYDNTKKKML